MPDFGIEFHFWRLVRVFGRQLNIDLEDAAFVRSALRAFNRSFPMPEIIIDDGDFNVGFFGLNRLQKGTVLAKSSNYFFIRISFFCIAYSCKLNIIKIRFINV